MKRARIEIPPQVKLVRIDFNEESLKDALESVGYDNREKTLFLWEGVSYYLEAESVNVTLGFVSRSLHNESAIAFDYTVSLQKKL